MNKHWNKSKSHGRHRPRQGADPHEVRVHAEEQGDAQEEEQEDNGSDKWCLFGSDGDESVSVGGGGGRALSSDDSYDEFDSSEEEQPQQRRRLRQKRRKKVGP